MAELDTTHLTGVAGIDPTELDDSEAAADALEVEDERTPQQHGRPRWCWHAERHRGGRVDP